MTYTVVSFHAHPDDEALLTAGTLARAAAEGHRVVMVCATDGAGGLVSAELAASGGLGERRMAELRRSAAAIGCSDVRFLGYDDSGMDGRGGRDSLAFARVDPEEPARRLAGILAEVGADLLTIYDPAGGYGHPDHIQVYRVGRRAAGIAGTAVVLEATVDRRALVRALGVLSRLGLLRLAGVDREEWHPRRFASAWADPDRITHRVDVSRHLGAKRAAMAAHASQATGGGTVRTLAVFVRLPGAVFRRAFGREWFVEHGRARPEAPLDDIFATLRSKTAGGAPTA